MANFAIISGRLTAAPELKYTASGVATCNFCVAVQRPYKKGEDGEADLINVVAWRHTAEFVAKYFKKGKGIEVSGSIRTDSWVDEDGKKRYKTEILADKVEFPISSKQDSAQSDLKINTEQQSSIDDFMPVNDEDLPF